VTRSEIPQLEVVTAIPDAESEDFLAQLLFSQGWSIIHRAFDMQSLLNFMEERGGELRTVIVYQSGLLGFSPDLLEQYLLPTITLIPLDGVSFNSHELMEAIRGKLRAPMLRTGSTAPTAPAALREREVDQEYLASVGSTRQLLSADPVLPQSIKRVNRPSNSRVRERRLIAITGSTGAPGRTRLATLLAEELSLDTSVILVDADIRSHGISLRKDISQKNRIETIPLDREERPTQIPEGDEVAIVDLGTLPGLAEAVTDRRWHGSLVNNILDRATHLIYVCKSTPTSALELAQFLREYPLLLKRIPVTYICILTGHSRELREWENKFLTLTMGESRYVLRESQLASQSSGGVLAALHLRSPSRREIAKIVTSLR
jgi:hypothetical protein